MKSRKRGTPGSVYEPRSRPLLVVLTGAYGNIGDAVIRRRVFEWIRDLGEIHAYVGNADSGWIEQLSFGESDQIYSAQRKVEWLRIAVGRRKPAGVVFDPGEVPLDKSALIPEIVYLLLAAVIRLRGGVVIRPPRGIGKTHPATVAVHRLSSSISNITLWRNEKSLKIVGVGQPSPDTAFQEPRLWEASWKDRLILGISMRGKRPYPSSSWFLAVKNLADEMGLQIVVFSQVREDESCTKRIAETLGAQSLLWGDASDTEHEDRLKSFYQTVRVVVSDRLHVLVLGLLAGAVPIEFADTPADKVSIHFSQIGVEGVSLDSRVCDQHGLVRAVENLANKRSEVQVKLDQANQALTVQQERARSMISNVH